MRCCSLPLDKVPWLLLSRKACRLVGSLRLGFHQAAIGLDLHRPRLEAVTGDVVSTLSEATAALDGIDEWVKPEPVPTPLVQVCGHA